MSHRAMLMLVCLGAVSGCGRVIAARPDGTRGGDCRPDDGCDPALECVRGICVPEGPDAGPGLPPPDGGPPPLPDAGPGPISDAGPGSPPDAGPGSLPDAGPPPPDGVLATGAGPLIGLFPTGDGDVLVVDSATARRVAPDGSVVATFAPGRDITAAAFDGTYLAVADRGVLTALDADLVEQTSQLLFETCASGVIVSDHRFVCGPDYDWDRIFATYDLVRGEEVARSDDYTYNGIPMERVPGTDYFVTVTTNLSPSDFHLYDASGDPVVFINESPYHGDFAATTTFAFHGSPATHLVTHQGIMLRIAGAMCAPDTYPGDCLVRDGELGTVTRSRPYVAMTEDGAGHIVGLVDPADRWSSDPVCDMGCTLHEVDSATRTVTRTRSLTDAFVASAAMEIDPADGTVLLGVYTAGDRFDGYTTYEVWRLGL